MVKKNRVSGQGFTLLEILLALGILAVLTVFGISLASSIRHAANVGDTERRMQEIAAKAKAFYRNSRTLPPGGVSPTTPVGIPVAANQLNLEQKYRQDTWGVTMEYYQANIVLGAFTIPNIDGYIFNSKSCAGILLSYGPNGRRDTTVTYGVNFTLAGDDIIVPIDVAQEAVEVALDDLKVLQSKVKAFDALYEGIDNNGADGPDNSVPPTNPPCTHALPLTLTTCPPISGLTNDPNCGTKTLDQIELAPTSYGCAYGPVPNPPGNGTEGGALRSILGYYALGSNYTIDPWGSPYRWGCESPTYACSYLWANTDGHYHKFYSAGPTASATDDIIP